MSMSAVYDLAGAAVADRMHGQGYTLTSRETAPALAGPAECAEHELIQAISAGSRSALLHRSLTGRPGPGLQSPRSGHSLAPLLRHEISSAKNALL